MDEKAAQYFRLRPPASKQASKRASERASDSMESSLAVVLVFFGLLLHLFPFLFGNNDLLQELPPF